MTDNTVPDTALRSVLRESVDEVLEKMFFIRSFGDPTDDAPLPEMVAHLTFEGDPSGWLALCVTSPRARSIAADFLGEDEAGLPEQQIGEVLCELANMICGSVLSRVESDSTFRLAAPNLVPPGKQSELALPAPGETSSGATYSAEIGNGRLMVIFKTEKRACPTAEKPAF